MDLQERATLGGRIGPAGTCHQLPGGGGVISGSWATASRPTARPRKATGHPDRNAQFEYINRKVQRFFASKQPVISVDTKKKELVGDFKNGGRELRPQGKPEKVRVHDFLIPELGRATP